MNSELSPRGNLPKKSLSFIHKRKTLPPVPKEIDFEAEEVEDFIEEDTPPPERKPPIPPQKLQIKATWPPVINENYTSLNSGRRPPPQLPTEVEEKLNEEEIKLKINEKLKKKNGL
jgi:hypothetical protein